MKKSSKTNTVLSILSINMCQIGRLGFLHRKDKLHVQEKKKDWKYYKYIISNYFKKGMHSIFHFVLCKLLYQFEYCGSSFIYFACVLDINMMPTVIIDPNG